MIIKTYTKTAVFFTFGLFAFFLFFFDVFAETLPIQSSEEIFAVPAKLIASVSYPHFDKSLFRENEEAQVSFHPINNDKSTNVAFYLKCPTKWCPDSGTVELPQYVFFAENLGKGSLPFSEYWAPPGPGKFVVVEYKNDNQQFSCSGISLDSCVSDSRFIGSFHFEVFDNNAVLPENTTPKEDPVVSSITSDLVGGDTVTVSIDGELIPDVPIETPVPEKKSVGVSIEDMSVAAIVTPIEAEVAETATGTEKESVTAPLDDSDTSTTTSTTTF